MILSNYNGYDSTDTKNFEGLNMLSTVFSVMFCFFNCFLSSLVFNDFRYNMVATLIIFLFLQATLMFTNFVFEDITYHTTVSIVISIVYTVILVPAFSLISSSVLQEGLDEAKLSQQQKD